MNRKINKIITSNNVLVLGFGKEGRSTARFLKKYYPSCKISIADQNENLLKDDEAFPGCDFIIGDDYLSYLDNFDLVIKSPGIPMWVLEQSIKRNIITSQTEIFLDLYKSQTIGITGTKGKSTTSSLTYSILEASGLDVILLGNIGVPPLDLVDQIQPDTLVVFEMSSHQLDGIMVSPKYAVYLNLFEEHLDHYKDVEDYRKAKNNIYKWQHKGDWVILNGNDEVLMKDIRNSKLPSDKFIFSDSQMSQHSAFIFGPGEVRVLLNNDEVDFDFSSRKSIPGRHNLYNIMAASSIGLLLGIDKSIIISSVKEFSGLEHRLEYVGKFKGIHFYNDSIATIPEATIEAVKTFGEVGTLILGGKDRGIDYSGLLSFLKPERVKNLILTGEVGRKLKKAIETSGYYSGEIVYVENFDELQQIIPQITPQNSICLLSPAASSYDMFNNFEERGKMFKKIAKNL